MNRFFRFRNLQHGTGCGRSTSVKWEEMNRFNLIIIQLIWLAGCSTEPPSPPLSEVGQGDLLLADTEPSSDASPDGTDAAPLDGQGGDGASLDAADGSEGCIDDLTFFKESIWQSFMASDCASCHVSGGLAEASLMVLTPGDDDESLASNMAVIAPIALDKTQGVSLLLLKPTGEVPHMGGQRFDPESTMYKRFAELVARFEAPGGCSDPTENSACDPTVFQPGPSPVRRLTDYQFHNTIQDLFAGLIDPGNSFPQTHIESGFSTYSGPNVVSGSSAQSIMETVEFIGVQVAEKASQITPCQGGNHAACLQGFLNAYGTRIYRRPLKQDEEQTLLDLFSSLPEDATFGEKLSVVIEMMLQSPQFLYIHPEEGEATTQTEGVVALSHDALASRLSYFLWDSMPDAVLFERAAAGDLNESEAIWTQVDRMLKDPRAEAMVTRFHREWLHLYRLPGLEKDLGLYPLYNAKLSAAMVEEIDRLTTHLVFETPGLFRNLLDTSVSFVNAKLAQLYQTPFDPAEGSNWVKTTLEPERKGLLNRAAFAAAHAYPHASAPIHRGHFIIENLLCQKLVIPPFPITELPEVPNGTVRDRLEMHREDPVCASCHERLDPLGIAFEHFDAIGQWRDTYENGTPVDATGTVNSPALSFKTSSSLTDQLKNLDAVSACYARQWVRYAYGRSEQKTDTCSLERIQKSFKLSGGSILGLIHAVTQSDSFRYRWSSSKEASNE
jgi:hypothetical protein